MYSLSTVPITILVHLFLVLVHTAFTIGIGLRRFPLASTPQVYRRGGLVAT
ncbi:hypothetical protein VP409E501_P0064 [Vibrio phage 409E50-1]|nr:hypothetical protein VP521E561_P0064 [Vibrio phage 521E56-1]CAH9012908.1 hypothetical protein VP384E501_P0064 [Vibrio phage 384E50-1]CAH9012935.1 hypothetical protein VP409E501_P0064 [Vibrio phage 409E50-1]CAH9012984.1 hypothetical protein VP402E501_P0064 [Vibrio phage 402E50-1]CAH9013757.1 hypothetical protein VP405E501_P0064 [Vibrio phage 405E50-1]CAH9013811.1 hypothetical protein VP413E501_P0064 [Vibrio phage 413E50-1]